jgi:hypothetical protein
MQFTAIEQSLVRAPFPVILASESEEQIELVKIRNMEYRAKGFLTLGKDISVLATDSLEHKSIIEAWLTSHDLRLSA